jgi:hypothetical protein
MESMGLPWIPVDSMDSMGFHNSKIPKVLWTKGNLRKRGVKRRFRVNLT